MFAYALYPIYALVRGIAWVIATLFAGLILIIAVPIFIYKYVTSAKYRAQISKSIGI